MARAIDLSDNATSGSAIDSSAATASFYQTLFDHFYGLLDRFGSTVSESINEESLIIEHRKYLLLIDKYQNDAKSEAINLLGHELTSAFPGSEPYGKNVANKITLQKVRDVEKHIDMSISMYEKTFANQGLYNGLLKTALLCQELGIILSNKNHQDKSISFIVKSNNLLSCWIGAYKYNSYLTINKKFKREPSSKKSNNINHPKIERSSTDERKMIIDELISLLSKKNTGPKKHKKNGNHPLNSR
ncbi:MULTISPECIES: hypothetical protein [unclassified Enterobacter]|jgi:uncharacterized membrane protein|uniref:hypothetical protein n=1 Tax=unclassified Enterobacter TaxID=2608935 RepID=UPI0015C77F84|nr:MULTISPECIES: hypothetical protein [unclassified Enterobacter]MBB3303907.1 putative membrane protein [Enterobacter sp. Sphag1F]NYI12988.1 putative membrane protein [Enterobacter sp. Sphag71]